MKHLSSIALLFLITFSSWGQINQISVGLGRADQWGKSVYTYVGDTAIGFDTQASMDSRTMYVVSLDHSFRKLNIYHVFAFSVMYLEQSVLVPGQGFLLFLDHTAVIKAPTIDYSINVSILRPTKRLTLYSGINFRAQWPKNMSNSRWANEFILNATNSVTPFTMGINLNLRYQTRWLRIEFGYIGDVTSSSRDFIHNGQIVNMAPLKMQKIYLVLSGPVFRREKPPKRLKKKDFLKN